MREWGELCSSLNSIRAREEGPALIQRRERKYFLPELLFLRWDLLLAQEIVPWLR
jgi:hypothetical protein